MSIEKSDALSSTPIVSELNVYPIKSCAGITLETARIGPRGFYHDRAYMLVDPLGYFITQREQPRMALITPALAGDGALRLQAPGMQAMTITPFRAGKRREVFIWDDSCVAVDQGDDIAAWFSAFLDTACRLVRLPEDATRPVDPRYAISQRDEVGFADGFPFLLITRASLDDLNARLKQPIPMNRFRPNIVVQNTSPYAEDTWRTIRIRDITFHIVKPCARCEIPTTDQTTAERGKEPLKTLSTYRHAVRGVMFGQNLIHEQQGRIRLGDAVEIIEVADSPNFSLKKRS
ncbi:MAG TPA: MOSC domain-containing protein [Ktedonobacteraceae bacterium]|jgi:uncharacterized protein YcbX|nr:MOSC domain-containing protein [Ktedonobacteraceae bacterium]